MRREIFVSVLILLVLMFGTTFVHADTYNSIKHYFKYKVAIAKPDIGLSFGSKLKKEI